MRKSVLSFHVFFRSRTEISRSQCLWEIVWWFCFRLNDFKSSWLWSAIVFFETYLVYVKHCETKTIVCVQAFSHIFPWSVCMYKENCQTQPQIECPSPFNCMCVGCPSTNQGWSRFERFLLNTGANGNWRTFEIGHVRKILFLVQDPHCQMATPPIFVWWYLQKHWWLGCDICLFTTWNPKQPFINGCLVKQPFSI